MQEDAKYLTPEWNPPHRPLSAEEQGVFETLDAKDKSLVRFLLATKPLLTVQEILDENRD